MFAFRLFVFIQAYVIEIKARVRKNSVNSTGPEKENGVSLHIQCEISECVLIFTNAKWFKKIIVSCCRLLVIL